MNKRRVFYVQTLALLGFLMSACSSSTGSKNYFVCENVFNLVSDFNHRYPEQGDYMSFIAKSSYRTYYDAQANGFNCRYYFEFKSGEIIEEWGTYACDGKTLKVTLNNGEVKKPVFTLYHSPTIDFFIIDDLIYEGQSYKLVYQAQYIITARG